ncbi:heat shock factor-binding 1 family protein [Rhodotorula paludigena]|uniref:heat shock factor-binding 1 family protein n=1 Tax=Rhodotorula paludigena TaxID=86838 RepID=UPI0031707419
MPFTQPLVPSPSLSSTTSPSSPALSLSSTSTSLKQPAPAPTTTHTVGLGVSGAGDLVPPPAADDDLLEPDPRATVTSPLELTHFVDSLLSDLEARFDTISNDVLSRLNGLSSRVDSLETSLAQLMSGNAPAGAPAAGSPLPNVDGTAGRGGALATEGVAGETAAVEAR